MNRLQEMVMEFHDTFNVSNRMGLGVHKHVKERQLRQILHQEEIGELKKAMDQHDGYAIAKELCDCLYVLFGTAIAYGIDVDKAFEEVHKSNMSKLGPNGEILYNEKGKVLKGPNYKEADMKAALNG